MKAWLRELCPEIDAWQVDMIAQYMEEAVKAEREACAKICVVQAKEADGSVDYSDACHDIAAAIRARGETK